MDELRWALLLLGGIVILAVYLYTRRQSSAGAGTDAGDGVQPAIRGEELWEEEPEEPLRATAAKSGMRKPAVETVTGNRVEPRLKQPPDAGDDADEPRLGDTPVAAEVDRAEPAAVDAGPPMNPDKIVAMRMAAKSGGSFSGEEIVLKLRELGLRHGKFSIFHQYEAESPSVTLFSVASMTEPGSFDLTRLRETRLPGVTLFMVLPGPRDPVAAFDRMVEVARTLARDLEGELLDESASTWSIQRERYIREELIRYRLQHPRKG